MKNEIYVALKCLEKYGMIHKLLLLSNSESSISKFKLIGANFKIFSGSILEINTEKHF